MTPESAPIFPDQREGRLRHNCGIVGVFSNSADVSLTAVSLLSDLNHRGQEGAGLVIASHAGDIVKKGAGLLRDVVDMHRATPQMPAVVSLLQLQEHKGHSAIGQVRYSTSGDLNAWQPFYDAQTRFSLVHNGTFTNVDTMMQVVPQEIQTHAVSDTWVAHQAILAANGNSWEEKIQNASHTFEGAYSLIMQSEDAIYGLRDPWGMRPLCIGALKEGGYILASEPDGLAAIGAKFVRDVKRGEGVVIDEKGLRSFFTDQRTQKENPAFCSFEYVYIASPDSQIEGRSVSRIREELGGLLAKEDRDSGMDMTNAIVVPIQDSGTVYAQGYVNESHLPIWAGLVKNNYAVTGRVFMMPGGRDKATLQKHRVDPFAIEGKDIILVDDSLVRGTTIRNLIQSLREAGKVYGLKGPRSIHVRIACPRILFPCYYGVDFATQGELATNGNGSDPVEQARQLVRADSLRYITSHQLVHTITQQPVDSNLSDADVFAAYGLCGHCFTGKQPIPVQSLLRKRR